VTTSFCSGATENTHFEFDGSKCCTALRVNQ
jgi:hypothetical protein